MITLAQAHEQLNDFANRMRHLAKGFNLDDEEQAARAAELDEALECVTEVLDEWFALLNPAPAEEAAPAPASAPSKPVATATKPADTSTKSGG